MFYKTIKLFFNPFTATAIILQTKHEVQQKKYMINSHMPLYRCTIIQQRMLVVDNFHVKI